MSLLNEWNYSWSETEKERPEYNLTDTSEWRVASKYRNPEDKDWWYTNGYKFFENWVTWRKDNPHMKIITTADNQLGIELGMEPTVNGVKIKMVIDRVFFNEKTKEHIIVDLKTGKNTPASSLQLGFYAYGLRKSYGIEVTKGYYWMARKGNLSSEFNLACYTDSKIEHLVSMFDKARKENIFLPNFDSCNMCGITAYCEWYIPKENINE